MWFQRYLKPIKTFFCKSPYTTIQDPAPPPAADFFERVQHEYRNGAYELLRFFLPFTFLPSPVKPYKLENCYSLLSMLMQQTSKCPHVLDLLSTHFSLNFFKLSQWPRMGPSDNFYENSRISNHANTFP